MSPYFSVLVVTCYNAGALSRAIESVIAQSFGDFELIVADDGSIDDAERVVGGFDDTRLRYVKGPHGSVGLGAAQGRFITCIDGDDEPLPKWLEFLEAALEEESSPLARCAAFHIGGEGLVVKTSFISPRNPLADLLPGTYALRRDLFLAAQEESEALEIGGLADLGARLRERGLESGTVVPRPLVRKRWGESDRTDRPSLRLRPRPPNGEPRLVSVVIPARNAAGTLAFQLAALSNQDYDGEWEVIVSDNGSTDATASVAAAWKPRLPSLTVVDASSKRGVAHARNKGAMAAQGELILMVDSDDEVAPSWLRSMVAAARHGDLIGAVLETESLNSERARAMRALPSRVTHGMKGFLPYAPGSAFGAWSDVIYWVGGWDESIVGGGQDSDLSWRAQLAGFRIEWAQDAVVHYRMRENLAPQLRQLFGYGRTGPLMYRRFRWAGLTRLDARGVAKRWAWLGLHVPDLFRGHAARSYWLRIATFRVGVLYGSIVHRVRHPQ